MASVVLPDTAAVRRLCGISEDLTGETVAAFDSRLMAFVADADARVAMPVGESVYDGTSWTARQASALGSVVGYRAGALFLRDVLVRKATGLQEPLNQEESERIEA